MISPWPSNPWRRESDNGGERLALGKILREPDRIRSVSGGGSWYEIFVHFRSTTAGRLHAQAWHRTRRFWRSLLRRQRRRQRGGPQETPGGQRRDRVARRRAMS